jgi:hypothetical protein
MVAILHSPALQNTFNPATEEILMIENCSIIQVCTLSATEIMHL